MPAAADLLRPQRLETEVLAPGGDLLGPGGEVLGRQHVRGRVDNVPAAVRPGRGHVVRSAASAAAWRPVRRARGVRSARALLLGLPGVLVGAEHGAVDDRLAQLGRGQPVLLEDPGHARSADVERLRGDPGGGRPHPVGVERRACRADGAHPLRGQPAVGVEEVTRPRLPSARLPRRVGSGASTSRSRPWAAAESSTGSRTAKARTSASIPRAAPRRRRSS